MSLDPRWQELSEIWMRGDGCDDKVMMPLIRGIIGERRRNRR